MISMTPFPFFNGFQPKTLQNTPRYFSSPQPTLTADRFEPSTPQPAIELRSGYSDKEMIDKLMERGFNLKEAKRLPGYFEAFGGQPIIARHEKIIVQLLDTHPQEIKGLANTLGLSVADCMRKLVLMDVDANKLKKAATPQVLFEQTAKQLGDNARALNNPTDEALFRKTIGLLIPFLAVQLH
jgi:hypothetical protein